MTYDWEHDPDIISKPEFIGFKKVDEVINGVDKKKNGLKMHIHKHTDISLEENDSLNCSPIVNNNHVNKNKKSKSRLPSLETNDKSNQSKRFKSNNLQSEEIHPSEVTNEQSLELTTPTFNLTSTSKSTSRRNVSRKLTTDINDPIYKIPFEHGWKRELVYRTTGDYIANNRSNRNGDVYYYSPNNRKLRSLREIQEQLNLSLTDNILTIDSFTFLKQPIGINDRSKELIRDANTKLSKEDSFVGVTVKPKKSKTPIRPAFDYALSDSENSKSPSKMKVVFKNAKKRSKSTSKKIKMEASSSVPEYIAEDWEAIQSGIASAASPAKVDDIVQNTTVDNRRNAEVNGSLREPTDSMACMQSFNYMVKAMRLVFKELKICDLLSASRVCTAWNIIAMNKLLWQNVFLKNSMVHDWEKCIDTINNQGTVLLDTRRMLISDKTDEFESFWLRFCKEVKRANKITNIELYRCPTHVVEDILYSLPQLKVLNATSIKNPLLTKDVKNTNDFMALNLKYLGQMKNLTEIRLKGLSGIKLLKLTSFKNLKYLKTLSLTSIKSFPKDTSLMLETVTPNLEHLEIGDCDCLSKEFATSLKKLISLKSLRLENCCGKWESFAQDIFVAIRSLKNLSVLELINIEFTNCVEEELEKCYGIRALLIIPAYVSQSATTNCHLIDCLKKLSKTLTHLVWGLTHELLRVTDLFISQYQQNQHEIGYSLELAHTPKTANNIPILRTRKPRQLPDEQPAIENEKDISDNVDILSVPALEKLLETMMVGARTKVVKIPFSKTTRVYLTEHLDGVYY